jgi:hypothetical protein
VRESIHRTDPINTALRWRIPIHRVEYRVKSPNSVWHIDSNLKLNKWGFYVQGGVDGYSRFITFMKVNSNNKSDSMLAAFKNGVEMYGLPSRIRCDHGGENLGIAGYMFDKRGLGRNSVVTGPSVRNVRIERMWLECRRAVLLTYQNIFQYMEEKGWLDIANPLHIYLLHVIYRRRIQNTLDTWVRFWNTHTIEGQKTRNCSPIALRESGLIKRFGLKRWQTGDVFDDDEIDHITYAFEGILNEEEPSVSDNDTSQHCALYYKLRNKTDIHAKLRGINTTGNDNKMGMRLYRQCLAAVTE